VKRYWNGRDLEELSREDLLVVVEHLSRELESTRAMVRSLIDIHELVRKIRKKEERNAH
jgi:hypothetical protein